MVQEVCLFHIFIITYYLLPFDNSYSDRCEVVSHVFFNFLMIMLVMHNKQVMLVIISIFKNLLIGFFVCFQPSMWSILENVPFKVRMCIWKVCILYWLQIECCEYPFSPSDLMGHLRPNVFLLISVYPWSTYWCKQTICIFFIYPLSMLLIPVTGNNMKWVRIV